MSPEQECGIDIVQIEKAAPGFTGGAGPGGVDGGQLSALLVNYGTHSVNLRKAFTISTRQLANSAVERNDVQAMNAKHEIALSKIKVSQPIGIGEASTRVQEKAMNLVSGYDSKYECNVD